MQGGYQEVVRSDAAWPIPVNGMGTLVHTRQLRQQDMDAKIRAMEQQHLSSQPIISQPAYLPNPYAWPQTYETQAPVQVLASNQYPADNASVFLDLDSQPHYVKQDVAWVYL
jgi:hypothetical protein